MLRSFRHQTYRDFEVVMVDDASTNAGTLAWINNIEGMIFACLGTIQSRHSRSEQKHTKRDERRYLLLLDADDFLPSTPSRDGLLDQQRTVNARFFGRYTSNPHSQKFSPYFKADFGLDHDPK
jgi:hypothetical protein